MKINEILLASLMIGTHSLIAQNEKIIQKPYREMSIGEFRKTYKYSKKLTIRNYAPGKYEVKNNKSAKIDTIVVYNNCGGCGMG